MLFPSGCPDPNQSSPGDGFLDLPATGHSRSASAGSSGIKFVSVSKVSRYVGSLVDMRLIVLRFLRLKIGALGRRRGKINKWAGIAGIGKQSLLLHVGLQKSLM